MLYSATGGVLTVQVMYKLLSLTKHASSVSRSECLALVTAVTLVKVTGLCFALCLSFKLYDDIYVDTVLQILQYKRRP